MDSITISKEKILRQKGVVVLSLKEYQTLCEKAMPVYCLSGKEAEEVDKLAESGLKEYRAGKCRTIKSLADLG